jgi:hypothetical protein
MTKTTNAWALLLVVGALATVFAIVPATPSAEAKPQDDGCSLIGSWIGLDQDGNAYFTSQYHGQSQSNGTFSLELSVYDFTLFGLYPDAVDGSTIMGQWVRVDDYSFAVSGMGIATDANGELVYTARLSGTDAFDPGSGCNMFTVLPGTLEIWEAGQNPLLDEPTDAFSTIEHPAFRIMLE